MQRRRTSKGFCLIKSVCLQGIRLLHSFLAGLEQAPRRKQPEALHRAPHALESFSGRLAKGVTEWPAMTSGDHAAPASSSSNGTPHSSGNGQQRAAANGAHKTAEERSRSEVERQSKDVAHSPAQTDTPDNAASRPTGRMHFQIDHVFDVTSVGTIVSGTAVQGAVEVGARCWWGPNDADGGFAAVQVASIHRSQVPVTHVSAGQCATLLLDSVSATRPLAAAAAARASWPDAAVGGTSAGPVRGDDAVGWDSDAAQPDAGVPAERAAGSVAGRNESKGSAAAGASSLAALHSCIGTGPGAGPVQAQVPVDQLEASELQQMPSESVAIGALSSPLGRCADDAPFCQRSTRGEACDVDSAHSARGTRVSSTVEAGERTLMVSSLLSGQSSAQQRENGSSARPCSPVSQPNAQQHGRPASRAGADAVSSQPAVDGSRQRMAAPGPMGHAHRGGNASSPGALADLSALRAHSPLSDAAMRQLSQPAPGVSASPDAMLSDASWQAVGLQLAGAPLTRTTVGCCALPESIHVDMLVQGVANVLSCVGASQSFINLQVCPAMRVRSCRLARAKATCSSTWRRGHTPCARSRAS